MKKLSLAIVILIGIGIFASLDYYLNINNKTINTDQIAITKIENKLVETFEINFTKSFLQDNPTFNYAVSKTDQVSQMFEKFDLSTLKGVKIYKNNLEKEETDPITVYEIQAEKGQGGIAYIATKAIVIDQIDATGRINEVSSYGYNAFFYNDINRENTVFLLTQIGDNLFGFQSNKQSFKIIESMIKTLTLQIINS